ncbi:hypothetical protein MTR67_040391 [Solanum verrucosum]|uniref:Tf2-1-like SH3-like domain-containing protein n=1 Tax=Solanum verrucosum TaxID=315347 RepID=A0AAF0UKN4_SOLVR|nr:hypothetical protein MTR67_040391 [Solanum verrucosum]
MKGVMRFGKKGNLCPIYVGPYRISKRISKVAYELELPTDLAAVHPVFHISLLKKCVGDPASIVPLESVAVKDSLSYEDVPIEILDRQNSGVTDGTHGHHPWTVDGLTVHLAGPWFVTENFPRTQSENLAKSRLMDRPTVRRSDHGPWFVSVDRDFPYQPLTQTTVDQHGPSFYSRSVGLTVDEVSS